VIRLVVFDFDGTLVDSNGVKDRCFSDAVAHLPNGAAALSVARSAGGDRYKIFNAIARQIEPDASVSADLARNLASDFTQRAFNAIAIAPERRGAAAALRELRRRALSVWVSSATPQRDLPDLLRARGVDQFVDGSKGAPRSKLTNLRTIMDIEGVSPRQTMVVGDGDDDEFSARRAGAWFVGITAERTFARQGVISMPDLIRLPAMISRLGAQRVQ
jgi:beta-phosphoglucomutase-like phosphatase (HAD superfamily)